MHNLTQQIRHACAQVAQRARQVRIHHERLAAYAASLPLDKALAPAVDPSSHYLADEAGTAAFCLTIDTINFGSGYFPCLRKRQGRSGYFTVAMSLKDHFDVHGPMSAGQLSGITPEDCRAIFDQDAHNGPAMCLMALFASALNDLGRLLLSEHQGSFANLIRAADHSAVKMIDLLARMPFYRDVHRYGDLTVPIYKRAQIASADLFIALGDKGLGQFNDLEQLTIFADNLVPHVLRLDGVLEYDPALAEQIDREQLLVAGSPEEVEIRACALHAVELMRAGLAQSGQHVTSMGLDYILWNRGQQPFYKQTKPRHRARCVYY